MPTTVRTDSATDSTLPAPPFRAPIQPVEVKTLDLSTERASGQPLPPPPWRIGDFETLRILGSGGFATVYLARQVSLDRQVALKVSANRSSEARTLASLEHDHIVQVFSETVEGALRLLCMQYVAGATLGAVIRSLWSRARDAGAWNGRDLLDAIDAITPHPGAFDPSALRDREALARCDRVQAVCRIGARLAEALAHAHGQGVLHRDIKSENILINQYGRALLADFNLALDVGRGARADRESFGGTLPYMAPEHLDALNRDGSRSAVDERSDIYALGVVLFEFLTGSRPFHPPPSDLDQAEALRVMAEERRAGPPSARARCPDVPLSLDGMLRRCLEPDPSKRFACASEMARALDGCRELRSVERRQPAPGPITRAVLRRPFLGLVLLMLMPHFLGSLVNIAYNVLQIVPELGASARSAFFHLVNVYNLVVYPVCLAIAAAVIVPVYRVWKAVEDGRWVPNHHIDWARRRGVTWPLWAVALSCLGWLPGGLVFPWALRVMGHPVDSWITAHLWISFWISGLIALTYCFFGVQFVALRALYPRLWIEADQLRQTARSELGGLEGRLRVFLLLAGLIPLAGAALMVGLGPDEMTRSFRLLITALIVAGMAGVGPTLMVSAVLTQTLTVLTGADEPPE